MQLAEWFCNGQPLGDASTGVPEYGPPMTNQEIFTLALAHFDSALSFTTATDAATIAVKNSINIAKGRVLVDLARYADAATAVAGIPTSYVAQRHVLAHLRQQQSDLGVEHERETLGRR